MRELLKKLPFLKSSYRRIRGLYRKSQVHVYVLKGLEKNSKQPLNMLYSGYQRDRHFIANLVYGADYQETKLGHYPIAKVIRMSDEGRNYDLTLITGKKELLNPRGSGNTYFIPRWIGGATSIGEALERTKKIGNIREDLRKIRKHKFQYVISNDPQDYESFYTNMYIPYVTKTYGESAITMAHKEMQECQKSADLLQIQCDDEIIAGVILLHENDHIRGWSLGVKNGERQYVKWGAIAAMYYFQLQYALGKGYKNFHFGGSRPFLKDGVLQFKKKWGMEVFDSTDEGFITTILNRTEAVNAFLQNNPFIHKVNDDFEGVVFLGRNEDISSNFQKLCSNFTLPGMSRLTMFLSSNQMIEAKNQAHIPGNVELVEKSIAE